MLLRSKWILSALWAGALALAQNPRPLPPPPSVQAQEEGDVPTFRSETRRVLLHVSVVDKNGKLLTDIPQSAFKVTENNAEQTIRLFRREDVPVSMGIIIDNSGSMRDKRAKVNAAALALVKESNPQDEVFIIDFNDDAYLDQDFTSDIKKMEEALEKIDSRGGTAMRNAISLAIDHIKKGGKRDKKVLLVITDGNDNASNETTLEQLVRKAQSSEVLIYSIGLLSEEEPREARSAKRALKALAEASGGLDYYPKDLSEVERITPEMAHEIRNQYLIEYAPTNTVLDGSFHAIKVAVTGFGRPTVRTRNGYYATAVPSLKSAPPATSSKK
jgi:VWFA-related protein